MRPCLLVLVSACGRIAFDPRGDASLGPAFDADTTGLPSGLLAWYPLDDPAGTEFRDVIGGRNGSCVGPTCPTPAPGHIGQGMQFDGVANCISISDAAALDVPAITIAIWADQPIPGLPEGMAQVSKRVFQGTTADNTWELEDYDTNKLAFTSDHQKLANDQIFSPVDAIVVATWQHLAATFDGATRRLYVDGAEVANGVETNPFSYDTSDIVIGCDQEASSIDEYFTGTLDDFQIYDHALSAAEIATLAQR